MLRTSREGVYYTFMVTGTCSNVPRPSPCREWGLGTRCLVPTSTAELQQKQFYSLGVAEGPEGPTLAGPIVLVPVASLVDLSAPSGNIQSCGWGFGQTRLLLLIC